uniref:Uncharacterized protein n=1 Tax=Arundo donax TaxID=35708 RepID=A0A0A9EE11_ARUDO
MPQFFPIFFGAKLLYYLY